MMKTIGLIFSAAVIVGTATACSTISNSEGPYDEVSAEIDEYISNYVEPEDEIAMEFASPEVKRAYSAIPWCMQAAKIKDVHLVYSTAAKETFTLKMEREANKVSLYRSAPGKKTVETTWIKGNAVSPSPLLPALYAAFFQPLQFALTANWKTQPMYHYQSKQVLPEPVEARLSVLHPVSKAELLYSCQRFDLEMKSMFGGGSGVLFVASAIGGNLIRADFSGVSFEFIEYKEVNSVLVPSIVRVSGAGETLILTLGDAVITLVPVPTFDFEKPKEKADAEKKEKDTEAEADSDEEAEADSDEEEDVASDDEE